MSLIRETKLNPIPIQTGYGVPSHISPAGSLYFDFIGKSEYLNKDGIVDWVPFATGENTFTGGTVTGPTTFLSDVTMSSLYVGNINDVDYINFNTSPTVPSPTGGTLFFDSNENALSYKPITGNNDVTVNIGQESLIKIYNDLGYQINNGQALHITGASAGSPTVSLAIGTGGDSIQFQISGIATHDIPDSSYGFMTVFGTVRDLNLTGFTVGEQIYLSQTVPGGLASYSGLSFTGRTCEVGHIIDNSASGKLQVAILNEIEATIITTQENNILAANNSSTGIFEFSGLSISTPSGTTFNVAPVQGWIIDNVTEPANPRIQLIIYPGSTGNTALYVSSATETYILLTSGLTITQQTTFPTPQQRRQNLYLGKFGHANRQFLINAFNEPDSSLSPVSQLRDIFTPIRLINGGIYPSANGNSLTFNTSGGVLYGLGLGYITNKLDPNSLSVSGTSPCTFQYRTQTGGTASNTTLITPGVYDNNGVVTSVGGGSNSSTNQRIYLVQNGQFRLQYGQQVYGSLAAAIEASQNEAFTTFSNFRDNAILIGILSVNKNATNLSNTTQARFLLTSKFGETVGAAGGISTTNLQQAYNNSATPEIVTNSAEGALSIQNGTGAADNVTNLFEGRNTATSLTSFIRADGSFSGSSLFAPTHSGTTFLSIGTYGSVAMNASSNPSMLVFSGSNTVGGTGYTDFIRVTNTAVGATNPTKTIRVNNTGGIEFLNSAYTAQTLTLGDNGILSIGGGNVATTSNNDATTNYLNFGNNNSQIYDDGNMHIHSRGAGQVMWINTNGGQLNLLTQSPTSSGGIGSGIAIATGTLNGYVTINTGRTVTTAVAYGYLTTGGAGTYPGGSQSVSISLYANNRIWGQEIDAFSDERMKDIEGEIKVDEGLKLVKSLKPIKYKWKDGDDKGLKAGYSAQQVIKSGFDHLIGVIPKEGLDETVDEDGFTSPKDTQFSMNYDQVVPYHGVVIKHLLEKIDELEKQIQELKNM
jgi:hypothetical protein